MRSHSFGSDRLVTGLPLSMRYAFLALITAWYAESGL